MAEGDAALLRGLARQREELRHLVGLESRRRARPRPIGKHLEDQALELEVADAALLRSVQFSLTIPPPASPPADRLGSHVELDRLLVVRDALPGAPNFWRFQPGSTSEGCSKWPGRGTRAS